MNGPRQPKALISAGTAMPARNPPSGWPDCLIENTSAADLGVARRARMSVDGAPEIVPKIPSMRAENASAASPPGRAIKSRKAGRMVY